MERRKVQQVGNSTYTVSLPKEWARAVDIEAGSEVSLQTHIDDILVVEPDRPPAGERTVAVSVDDASPTRVEALVRATYAAGVERARFTADGGFDEGSLAVIRATARRLSGVTIDREASGEVCLDTLLDPSEVSIQQSVRQLTFVALGAHRDAVAAALGSETPAAPGARDDHANRMFALVDRHVQRALESLGEVDALGLSRPELFACWRTARALERVADHAERIAALGADIEPDGELAARLAALAERTQALVEAGVDTVLEDREPVAAQAARRERAALHADLRTVHPPFEELDLHRLQTGVYEPNRPSQRVMEKLGFVREGVERESIYIEGAWYDTYKYGLLRSDWDGYE